MSFTVDLAFVNQYRDNVDMLVRQRGSRLRRTVTVDDNVNGQSKFTEQIGAGVAVRRTSRHADTTLTPTPHARRKYDLFTYDYSDLIDKPDKVRMLIDPESPYSMAAKDALGHAQDDEIIAAATGTAQTGANGGTSTPLPASQQVAVDLGGASEGLTVGKLRRANYILQANDVDPEEERFCVLSARQIEDLLAETQVTSREFTTLMALMSGEVQRFMGFTMVRSQRLALNTTTDVRTIFCHVKSGIELGVGSEIMVRIGERADKNYSTQVFASMDIGSTRLQEEKVVSILCDESP